MKIHRRVDTEIKIVQSEFMEALGLGPEGSISELKIEFDENYHRYGSGASVISIKTIRHEHAKRLPRPLRKKR